MLSVKSKRFIQIMLLLGLCVAGFSSCTIWQDTPAQNISTPAPDTLFASTGKEITQEPIFMSCMARSITPCSQELIADYAKSDSIQKCTNFKDPLLVQSCSDAVSTELAKKSLDTTLCTQTNESHKQICINQVLSKKAIDTKDIKICQQITLSPNSGSGAMALFPRPNERDLCILQVINTLPPSQDAKLPCETLKSEINKKICIQDIENKLAIIRK